jgi:NADH-quinone oxidoreductase subunit E
MSEAINIGSLSDAEVRAIEAEIAHLPDRESAAIEALRIVQENRGWVSDESLTAIAQLLCMSADALDAIATFYNLIFRQPVGRHVVMYCDSVSCYVMGCDKLKKALVDKLGIQPVHTTADDRFTLIPIVCLGACDHAPVMMIGEDLIHDAAIGKLDAILGGYE